MYQRGVSFGVRASEAARYFLYLCFVLLVVRNIRVLRYICVLFFVMVLQPSPVGGPSPRESRLPTLWKRGWEPYDACYDVSARTITAPPFRKSAGYHPHSIRGRVLVRRETSIRKIRLCVTNYACRRDRIRNRLLLQYRRRRSGIRMHM